jgi:hypothetical protein
MNDQKNEFISPEDAAVRDGLANIYAAPSDPAYWSDLQIRILTRIADSDPGLWWMFLGRWARAGIVAAALALMAAGVAAVMNKDEANQIAFQSLLDGERTPITAFERVGATAGLSDEEAALRYVLSLTEGLSR